MNDVKIKTELSVHNIHILSEAITPKSVSIGDASRLILNAFEFSRIYSYARIRAFISEHKSKFETNGINFKSTLKKDYVPSIVQQLKNDAISIITIPELCKYVNEHFDITMNETDIYRIGLREALMQEGIQFKTNQVRKEATRKILDQTIEFYKKNTLLNILQHIKNSKNTHNNLVLLTIQQYILKAHISYSRELKSNQNELNAY
jgi:hypothetical protein